MHYWDVQWMVSRDDYCGDINYPLLMGEKAQLKVDADSFTLTLGAD